MKLKCASFFAGVGGIDYAFEQANFEIIYANEFDKNAVKTYEYNHSVKVDGRDIRNIQSNEIPDFDIMLGGFPCQAFSLAGLQKGFNDARGNLFFELERIFKEKKPKIIFLENVKNLVTHDKGNTFRIILERLKNAGYYVKYQILNAKNYGDIPQNRERIYIVAFLNKNLWYNFDFPKPILLRTRLENVIDFHTKIDNKYYYTPKNCSFYDQLLTDVKNKNTIYQWRRSYIRENKNNVCPTLTANMGTGGHNVPFILSEHGVRKVTPNECFRIQGFPKNFMIPNISNGAAYKQAGNSVVIPVITRIADRIQVLINQKNLIEFEELNFFDKFFS
jgi:DNA (cytosine-5)-methyltransferase 1